MGEMEIMRLVRFGIETLNDYKEGRISKEELDRRETDMKKELRDANELWENANK